MDAQKTQILEALRRWIAQRPGLDFGNYGDLRSYRTEMRGITRDYRDAMTLLRAVEMSSITGAALADTLRNRLTWNGARLDYVTGQYWPTEYRKAAAAALALALWRHHAADYPAGSGAEIRKAFVRMFGRGIASRWFQ